MEEICGALLTEVAKVLQKKYSSMSEVYRLTEETSQALSRNDKVSIQMLLGMREEELDKIRECDKQIYLLQDSAPPELSAWISRAVKGEEVISEKPYGKEGEMVLRIAGNVRSVWERTIVLDRNMNRKLAGKDSFYDRK